MKSPPAYRLNTITRANVEIALMEHPDLDTPEKVAEYFCGIGVKSNHVFAEARHVLRAAKPMKAKGGS